MALMEKVIHGLALVDALSSGLAKGARSPVLYITGLTRRRKYLLRHIPSCQP